MYDRGLGVLEQYGLESTAVYRGKELGKTLDLLLHLVLEEPEKNTKEYLLSKIKNG